MFEIEWGKVKEIIWQEKELTEAIVEVAGRLEKALNYNFFTGLLSIGDEVLLNTTAVRLNLGTGGKHFILQVKGQEIRKMSESGHIMKMRYTPWQIQCLAVEEEESPYHQQLKDCKNIGGMPVVIGCLHSMLPLVVAGFFYATGGKGKVVYIMTDGAALPLALSNHVRQLKKTGLLSQTITVGHSFGGDWEAVNVYTGLLAAYEVEKADLAIVCMGPGIVGTGTAYGFTGVEQGEIINSVNILGGIPLAVPRLSFTDLRSRHKGVSEQTLIALGKIALTKALVVLPFLGEEKRKLVWQQIEEAGITRKHQVIEKEENLAALGILAKAGITVSTMGRGVEEEKEYFQAAVAAGRLAANIGKGEKENMGENCWLRKC